MSENTDSIESIPSEETVNPVEAQAEPADDYSTVIQKNVEHYKESFKEILEGKKSSSWNWCAFLVPVSWSFYRKMYGVGSIIILINMAISAFNFLTADMELGILSMIIRAVVLIANAAFAVYADYLYKIKTDKIIASAEGKSPAERKEYLKKSGGVSVIACVLVLFFYLLLISLAFAYVCL